MTPAGFPGFTDFAELPPGLGNKNSYAAVAIWNCIVLKADGICTTSGKAGNPMRGEGGTVLLGPSRVLGVGVS